MNGQGSLCIGLGGGRGPFGARRERLVVGLVLGDLGKRLGHLQAIIQLLFSCSCWISIPKFYHLRVIEFKTIIFIYTLLMFQFVRDM
jgi:hypothetical protein